MNWLETNCRVTTVIENARPATVMSDPAIVERIVRAAVASPSNANSTPRGPAARSIPTITSATTPNARAISAGDEPETLQEVGDARPSVPVHPAYYHPVHGRPTSLPWFDPDAHG